MCRHSEASDVYDADKEPIGEITLVGIERIETTSESRCARGCGFDVQAVVNKGGDESGRRVFVFEARTPELAHQWMEEICKATGVYNLRARETGNGGWIGLRNESAASKRSTTMNLFSNPVGISTLGGGGGGGGGEGGGDEDPIRRSSIALGRGGAGRGGGGRGGTGRGEAFLTGSLRRPSVTAPPEPSRADYGAPIDFGSSAKSALSVRGGRGGRGYERRLSSLPPSGI